MMFGGFTPFTLIDYPGKTAAMVYTIGCNFRCPYCHNPELVSQVCETKIDEEKVIDFLRSRVGLLDGVVITGGEPSMHGDNLINFMRRVKLLNFSIKLDSNGVDPSFLQKVIQENLVDYIAMDIKSPMVKYMQTVNRSVDVEAIRKSIELIKSSGKDYEFRTTVLDSLLSFDDIDKIGTEISGAKRYFLQKFVSTKTLNPKFAKKSTYKDEDFIKMKTLMERYVDFCGIR